MLEAVAQFLRLRPLLRDVRDQDDGLLTATYESDASNREYVALVANLHERGVIKELRENGHLVFPSELTRTLLLSLQIDTGGLPGYYETFDSLIKSHPASPPSDLIVWEKNERQREGYSSVCRLLELLKAKAEVWDSTDRRFFLVGEDVLEVPLTSYVAEDTVNLPEQMSSVTRFLHNDHLDADVRWAFVRRSSIRVLRDVSKQRRLGILLQKLKYILERARQDHSLYLERFSFEDLLKSFDEKRLKFVGDLNQVLGGIQTALVSVPIGFFLIAEKLKPVQGYTVQNMVLVGGGLVFCILLFLLSLNQGTSLAAIKLALMDFDCEQRKKVTDQHDRLNSLISSIWSQYWQVRRLLYSVRIIVLIFGLLIVGAGLWCSIPAWQAKLP